eukprot:TRINITY_DN59_c0_g1_i7.p1 TRINITY_DN59_c0_g1~~TRINITY_DN59_c0_g1_i7.p1  ORF type:complete len:203 (+),score=34.57 TRINITY_DN59_c0_g1_i7:153-761(+)
MPSCGKLGCKWCAKGECYGPGGGKGGVKQTQFNKKGGGGGFGGFGGDGNYMAMLAALMAAKGGGKGKGGGGPCGKPGCKWCAMGECWGSGGGGGKGKGGGGNIDEVAKGIMPCDPSEVDVFLAMHQVEPNAESKLRGLDPRLQRVVIAQGSMAEARSQTGMLIMRCARASKVSPGDWICPACNDLQYSRNTACRQCSSPKPW